MVPKACAAALLGLAAGIWQRASAAEMSPGLAHVEETDEHIVELSFGESHLFSVPSPAEGKAERTLPTVSALLMGELLFPRWSIVGVFNLPLATQKAIVSGQIVEEFAAPAITLGVRWSALSIETLRQSRLELQLAALGGVTIGSPSGDVVFPLLAGRLHLRRPGGFAIYLGTTFAFRKDTWALLYGVGHRF